MAEKTTLDSRAEAPDVRSARKPFWPHRLGLHRYSASHFLAALVLLFVATPFINRPPFGDFIEAGAVTLVMLSATLAVGGRGKVLLIAILLVIPVLAAKWTHHFAPGLLPAHTFEAGGAVFLAFIAVQLLMYVLRAPAATREVVCAGISTYLVLGLFWAFAYMLAASEQPNSFANFATPVSALGQFEAFYFSFITLTTIGYGDITPLSQMARMLAVVEGVTGVLFTVTLISRLVSTYVPSAPSNPARPEGR